MHSGRTGMGAGVDLYRVADHEGGIEAKAKVADDAAFGTLTAALVFLNEIHCARKGDGADIALQLLLSHTDAVVLHRQRFGSLVKDHVDAKGCVGALCLAKGLEATQLGNGVGGVGNDFAQEDILLGIEPFFAFRTF